VALCLWAVCTAAAALKFAATRTSATFWEEGAGGGGRELITIIEDTKESMSGKRDLAIT
jgi:hypothetical protein